MSYTSDHSFVPRTKMKLFAMAATVAALLTPASAFAAGSVCLQVNRIDHTQVLNDHQILFYMVGRKEVWVNNLSGRCPTLTSMDGWAWSSAFPEYCDNVETIRVLRSGEVCQLGAFTPYDKSSHPS